MLCGCGYLGCGLYCGRFVIWLGVLVFVWLVCGFVGFVCVGYLVDGLCLLCLCGVLSFEGWFLCFGFDLRCGVVVCVAFAVGLVVWVFALMKVGVGVFGYVGACCGVAS